MLGSLVKPAAEREKGPLPAGVVGMELEGSSNQAVSGSRNGAEKLLRSVRQKGVAKGFEQAVI